MGISSCETKVYHFFAYCEASFWAWQPLADANCNFLIMASLELGLVTSAFDRLIVP